MAKPGGIGSMLQWHRHRQRRDQLPAKTLGFEPGRQLVGDVPGENRGAFGLIVKQIASKLILGCVGVRRAINRRCVVLLRAIVVLAQRRNDHDLIAK